MDQVTHESNPAWIKCQRCSASARLLHMLFKSRERDYMRVYKCNCGEIIWSE